ncbi:MAG TPA: muconolactone Delta-isomerase family protein [Polyangia bacterium]|jgi:muconolactone delta-isomerase|nr:muconolactone Delta-isomerase family protein [Polyangia bacterium]
MRFMASIVIKPPSNPQELLALLPAEKERVGELLRSGAIEAAFPAAQQRRAWLVVKAETAEAARGIVASLPLHPYFEVEYTPLDEH